MTHNLKIEPSENCDQVCNLLQNVLYDFIDLSAQAKQAHWTLKGSNFLSLHDFFDTIAETASGHADLIAERIIILGRYPVGTLQACAAQSSLPEYPSNLRDEGEHIKALSIPVSMIAQSARECIDDLEGFSDPVSADILTEVSRSMDMLLWKLSSSR